MLHPALARALVTAHIEDLHRAAARRHAIRFARRVVREPRVAPTPIVVLRSASTRLRGRRAQADGMTRTEIPQAATADANASASETHPKIVSQRGATDACRGLKSAGLGG